MNRKLMALACTMLVLGGLAAGGYVTWEIWAVGINQGYAPEQPIDFSHKLHAGENEVPCLYCHSGAERSRHAGIPAVNVCMNCHSVLERETRGIQNFKEAVAQGRPIEWVKIHNLPDFVYFNHSQHVRAGGVACQECHGPVEELDLMRQEAPLTMGWCLDCHRSGGMSDLASDYNAHREKNENVAVSGLDCGNCHY